jgi:ubiquinone/menaquinone biosynthesis C-methylase UbiE
MADAGAGVEKTLSASDIHERWEDVYRTKENAAFYDLVYDRIVEELDAPVGSAILDGGCGPAAHSIGLAQRGFDVVAADFSEVILKLAAETVDAAGMSSRISLQREDLTRLSFTDGAFRYVFCWGVLMHIPDVKMAVSELCRVVAPGGSLVISEGNMHSAQTRLLRLARRLFGGETGEIKVTDAGLERWQQTLDGPILARNANIGWIINVCAEEGLTLKKKMPGQFSEAYAKIPRGMKRLSAFVHAVNRFWFKYIGWAGPSFGNVLIFEKTTQP